MYVAVFCKCPPVPRWRFWRHITHMNELCRTHNLVMSHVWMGHVTRMNQTCVDLCQVDLLRVVRVINECMNWWCDTYEPSCVPVPKWYSWPPTHCGPCARVSLTWAATPHTSHIYMSCSNMAHPTCAGGLCEIRMDDVRHENVFCCNWLELQHTSNYHSFVGVMSLTWAATHSCNTQLQHTSATRICNTHLQHTSATHMSLTWAATPHTPHVRMSSNEAHHTCAWVTSGIWMRHVTHINARRRSRESELNCNSTHCTSHKWVAKRHVSYVQEECVAHTNASCHKYQWIMSQMWMRRCASVSLTEAATPHPKITHTNKLHGNEWYWFKYVTSQFKYVTSLI